MVWAGPPVVPAREDLDARVVFSRARPPVEPAREILIALGVRPIMLAREGQPRRGYVDVEGWVGSRLSAGATHYTVRRGYFGTTRAHEYRAPALISARGSVFAHASGSPRAISLSLVVLDESHIASMG